MEDASRFGPLIERFASIKEKYGDDYPIIFYDPNIESKEKTELKDFMKKNSSIHLFSESEGAFQFAQSLGISFILIVSSDSDEPKLIQTFQGLQNTYERRMFDFEEEALLKDLFKENSDHIRKSMKVYVFCTLLDCLTESTIKEDEEEAMVMCDIKDLAKEFRQEFDVIWYDPERTSENKAKLEEEIEIKIDEGNIYTEFEDLYERLKKKGSTPYHLIMSRSDEAERVLREIDMYQDLLGLYIYCHNFQMEKKIDQERVEIRSTIEELVPRIKEGIRTRSKLKNTFPAFATNFDTSDRSGIYKLHYYLKGLINFHNRKQAKEDFIKLAWKIYQDKEKELARFEDTYNEYNKSEILRWYTKDSPIYKLINNCLRISSSDSILYCRLILKDLERAIREEYQEKSKAFSGAVFRGAYISTEEWEKLERNIGEEIEMYGFLSTTVDQRTAVNFLKADPQNKVLIKIIVPPLPEEDEQGFADISKFSEFQNEREILFNVRSRFKILEAGAIKIDNKGTKCRHLVLSYGAQLLRKYTTKQKPSIEIMLELPRNLKCNLCGSIDKLFGYERHGETLVNCLECLAKGSMPKDTPLIALNEEQEKRIVKTLQGEIFKSKEGVTFANSGYKCHDCGDNTKEKYYKWMSFDDKNVLVQCSECFEKKKKVENKILLAEGGPYAMWQEEQKKWETVISDYQGILSQKIGDQNQGHIEMEVQNYDRCIEYGKKVIEKFQRKRRREVLKLNCFYISGEALVSSGRYQEALKYFARCMDVIRFIDKENGPDGVRFYCKFGYIHYYLSEYQKALNYFKQALKIQIAVFGENHEGTSTPYYGLALVYARLGERHKALEYFTKAIDIHKSISGENNPHLATAYNNLASHYRDLGEYEEALKYSNKALHIKKSIYGKKHSETAGAYGNLASLYHHLAKYKEAEKFYMKAIDIQKNIHGTNHPEIAASYNNLAGVYTRLGRHQEAQEYFNKANDIHKSRYGGKHSETANSLNNIGINYQGVGNFQKALEYFHRALDLRKSIFGENHADVAASYNNIATIQESLGNSRAALEHFQNALSIQKHIYPEHHPAIATSYKNIANVYDSLGNSQKAVEYYSNALVIQESVYRSKHPDIAVTYSNMGYAYDLLGDHEKAIKCYNQAIEIQLAVYGKKSPDIATSYNNLGKVYEKLGEYLKALGYFQIALDLQLSIYGEDHPNTLTSYSNIGGAYESLGNYQEAVKLHTKVLNKRIVKFGEMHPDTATSYSCLGSAQKSLGHDEQALEYHTKALNIQKSIFGEKHRYVALSYNDLASVYINSQEYELASEYYMKALSIEKSIHPEKHPTVATAYNNLGTARYYLEDYKQAREYFSKAVEIRESVYKEKHPHTASSYDSLGSVYCSLREYGKAFEYHIKALKLRESIFEGKHPDIADSYNKIGYFYYVCDDNQKAKHYFKKALDILQPLYGDQHPQTATTYGNLFGACKLAGETEEANKYLKILIQNRNYAHLRKFAK